MEVAADRRSSAGQLEHIQQLQAQQGVLVSEREAARALVAQEHRQPRAQFPQPPPQQPQPPVITQLTQPTAAQQATRQRRSGTKNYSNDELLSLLRCIQRVLPIGQDMWEMVARLHSMEYSHCQRDAKSIKTKYLRLANEKPSTGNPNMPEATRLAKEIKLAIDLNVGNTNPESNDFFHEGGDALSEATPSAQDAAPVPRQIAAAPPFDNTTTNAVSATTASKKPTRTNQVVGGEKSRKKFGSKRGKSIAWNEKKSVEQEKKLRSDAAETGRKKGIISSSSY
jgi:hypothetical protein